MVYNVQDDAVTFEATIPESSFGNLTKTMDICILRGAGGIIGQVQDDGNLIDQTTILNRIPIDANLEFVFARKMQTSYFTETQPFSATFENTKAVRMAYFKAHASRPKTKSEPIPGLPSKCLEGYGVVIEIDQ